MSDRDDKFALIRKLVKTGEVKVSDNHTVYLSDTYVSIIASLIAQFDDVDARLTQLRDETRDRERVERKTAEVHSNPRLRALHQYAAQLVKEVADTLDQILSGQTPEPK